MRFFDSTPSARILNRFSKDMDEGKRTTRQEVMFQFLGYDAFQLPWENF